MKVKDGHPVFESDLEASFYNIGSHVRNVWDKTRNVELLPFYQKEVYEAVDYELEAAKQAKKMYEASLRVLVSALYRASEAAVTSEKEST